MGEGGWSPTNGSLPFERTKEQITGLQNNSNCYTKGPVILIRQLRRTARLLQV